MSLPVFPEVSPDLTREQALNMLLASIAMEEVSLSHIIDAEGEKLQYVLGTLGKNRCNPPDVDRILQVNQSVTRLLDSVSQNQMLLKGKMESALQAYPEHIHPCPPEPPCPPVPPVCRRKCSAVFKAAEKCRLWRGDTALHWHETHISGECFRVDPCDKTQICMRTGGRVAVSLMLNVRAGSCRKCEAAVCFQMTGGQKRTEIYTAHGCAYENKTTTITMSNIIVENPCHGSCMVFRLATPDCLMVEDSMLSIFEI